jgi:hypothetical protein
VYLDALLEPEKAPVDAHMALHLLVSAANNYGDAREDAKEVGMTREHR